MKKGYKTGLIIILILIIAILGAYIYSQFFYNARKTSGFSVVVDRINHYNYTLDERDTKLMKSRFDALKNVLSKDNINYSDYASYLSQMYIIDLYDLDTKVNKYDIPCLEYIYKSEQDKFKLMIKDQFYAKLEDNSDEDRKQELPTVSSINVDQIKEDKFVVGENEFEAFFVNLAWEYKEDLGYDKKGEVVLVKDDNKLYVVKYTPIMD